MTDRQITHGPGCWGWGPAHYECAVRKIEALRSEVAEWKRVATAQAELHDEAEARAERLAEALRNSADALERLAFAIRAPNAHTPQLVELAIAMRAAALRDQEASND